MNSTSAYQIYTQKKSLIISYSLTETQQIAGTRWWIFLSIVNLVEIRIVGRSPSVTALTVHIGNMAHTHFFVFKNNHRETEFRVKAKPEVRPRVVWVWGPDRSLALVAQTTDYVLEDLGLGRIESRDCIVWTVRFPGGGDAGGEEEVGYVGGSDDEDTIRVESRCVVSLYRYRGNSPTCLILPIVRLTIDNQTPITYIVDWLSRDVCVPLRFM